MTEPTKEFVEIVKAGCELAEFPVHRFKGPCLWPECEHEIQGWICKERAASIKAALSAAFEQEPSDTALNEMARAFNRAGLKLSFDWNAATIMKIFAPVYYAMAEQKLRNLGIEGQRNE